MNYINQNLPETKSDFFLIQTNLNCKKQLYRTIKNAFFSVYTHIYS